MRPSKKSKTQPKKKTARPRSVSNNNRKVQSSVMGTIEDITVDATSAAPTTKKSSPSTAKATNQNTVMLPPTTPPPVAQTPITPVNQSPMVVPPMDNTIQSPGVPTMSPYSQPATPPPVVKKALRDNPTIDDGEESERRRIKEVTVIWMRAVLTKGVAGLLEEYRAIPNDAPEEKAKAFKENPKKNRYHNIPCCDATRVRLQFDPSFYIHANVVSSAGKPKRYICSQAPTQSTAEDFWTMIVTTEIEMVVMLCDVMENGKQKSFEYFPTKYNETMIVGKVCRVTLVEQREIAPPNLMLSTFRVANNDNSSAVTVKHIHWHNWPDHGVPDNYMNPNHVMSIVRLSLKPVIIHCSAGVGRTGTLVLIFILLESFRLPTFSGVPPLLAHLRQERYKAVQTEMQYLYVHRCVIEYLARMKQFPHQKDLYDKFIRDYDQHASTPPPALTAAPAAPAQ